MPDCKVPLTADTSHVGHDTPKDISNAASKPTSPTH